MRVHRDHAPVRIREELAPKGIQRGCRGIRQVDARLGIERQIDVVDDVLLVIALGEDIVRRERRNRTQLALDADGGLERAGQVDVLRQSDKLLKITNQTGTTSGKIRGLPRIEYRGVARAEKRLRLRVGRQRLTVRGIGGKVRAAVV